MQLRYVCAFIFLGFGSIAMAQPYRAVKTNGAYFFSDLIYPDDYPVKAYRVDTATVAGGDSLFRSYGQLEGDMNCYSLNGAHWTGRWIRVQPNGDTWFYTCDTNTILIRTQAGVGDSWTMYSGRDKSRIAASVVSTAYAVLFSEGIQSLADTVKYIRLQHLDSLLNPITNSVWNDTLVLSRNYGMVKWFEPYIISSGNGVRLRLSGVPGVNFGMRNITWKDIYDIQPGTHLHIYFRSHYGFDYTSDSIIRFLTSKTIFGDFDSIRLTWTQYRIHEEQHQGSFSQYYRIKETIVQMVVNYPYARHPRHYMNALPGQAAFRYNPELDYSVCQLYPSYKEFPVPDFRKDLQSDTCMRQFTWSGCLPPEIYYRGAGGPFGTCENGALSSTRHELVYFHDSTHEWGTPFQLDRFTGVEETAIPGFSVSPNPAHHEVQVTVAVPDEYRLELLDCTGRLLLEDSFRGTNHVRNLQGLAPGMYLLTVSAAGKSSAVRKLLLR